MKYWLIGAVGVIILGVIVYIFVHTSHINDQVGGVNTLNLSPDAERQACLSVLSGYAPKHPMDLKCSMHVDENGDIKYYFSDPSTGDVLTIDTTAHTSVLTDKNGKVLSSN